MPNRTRRRAGRLRQAARRRADEVAARMGIGLKQARKASGRTQAAVAADAGISQPWVSKLEHGHGGRVSIETWAATAAAADLQLVAFLELAPGAAPPRDHQHLLRQELVIRTAAAGAWDGRPEVRVADGPTSAAVDVLLTRATRREVAVTEIWDWFGDVGAAMRNLDAKVAGVRARMGPGWRVEGLMVVRRTRRNRELATSLSALFAAKFPASGRRWLAALNQPTEPMPSAAGLIWTDVPGTRLLAVRLRGARARDSATPALVHHLKA